MSILEALLRDLPLSAMDLVQLVRTAPHRYKVYSIPKRSGKGDRVIAQPAAEVKLLQRWIVENVLVDYPVHDVAVAYREGVGIKHNALRHVKNRFLLKMDFKDFFPSINAAHFELHTRKYAPQYLEDVLILTNILFRAPKGTRDRILSIGAPSSPVVSNSIVYDFDVAMSELAQKHDVTYTRYADDLVFSTNAPSVLRDLHKQVVQVSKSVDYPRLTINEDKTIFASKKVNRIITGLVLSNEGRVSIGWEKKRALRNLVYRFEQGNLAQDKIEWLRGYLAFVRDVEPELFLSLKAKAGARGRSALFGG